MKLNISKKEYGIFIGMAIVLCINIGIILFYSNQINGNAEHSKQEGNVYQYHYVLITDSVTSDFWDSVYLSANELGKELDVYVESYNEGLKNELTVEEKIDLAIMSQVDGILLSTKDSEEVRGGIDRAFEAGIPTVTMLTDIPESESVSYLSGGTYDLGQLYANLIIEEGLLSKENEGQPLVDIKIGLLEGSQGSGNGLIYMGLLEKINENYENVEVDFLETKEEGIFKSEEEVRNILLDEEIKPDYLICLDEESSVSAYQAIIDLDLVGEVELVAFHTESDIMRGIEVGAILGTVALDTNGLGQKAVNTLNSYITKGYATEYDVVQAEVITEQTIRNKEN